MDDDAIARAMTEARARLPATLERLTDLVRIPSCSFPGFPAEAVQRSAAASAAWLTAAGFPAVEVIQPQDAGGAAIHPYVLASDHRAGPDQPTLLLYAHHDVQPPLRTALWTSPPFAPEIRDGRLYGRGAADDKAGIAIHAASAAAWYATAGRLPINVTVIIEGEEEIGSPHFSRFLAAHRAALEADCLVIADVANADTGLPSLTTSLRGLVAVEVELRALRSPLHSGMWGGPVPDAVAGLCRLLASLSDATGAIAIPGIEDDVRPLSPAERAAYGRIPFDAARFADQAGLLAGASAASADGIEVYSRMWRRPSVAINAIQAGQRGQTGNVIMDQAWARLGIRIVPDMRPDRVERLLRAHLEAHTPPGMELRITPIAAGEAWGTETGHPVFALAERALAMGYGRAPVVIGCGGSIPFVGEMTQLLGGIPALLVGVEDPACAAHAENESLHLGDFASALAAQTAFFGLCAQQAATVRRRR